MDPTTVANQLASLEMVAIGRANPGSGSLPYATHEGVLRIPGACPIRVYQLNTGQRVFNADDVAAFFSLGEDE